MRLPFNLGLPEVLIILVIVLIVFGVGRLPEVGGALGKSIREFKDALRGEGEAGEGEEEKGEEEKAA